MFTGDNQYVKAEGRFNNLIVDGGLDQMGSKTLSQAAQYISVGTGSTAPATGQTSMVSEIARTSRRTTGDATVTSGVSFSYWSIVYVFLFIETEANGNLTEVGFFDTLTVGTMFARQLFKDNTGTPTTVVKTSSDQLQISYEVRLYPPTVDTAQTGLVISTVSYNIATRARAIGTPAVWQGYLTNLGSIFTTGTSGGRAFDGTATLGPTTGGLSGSSVTADTSVAAAYTNGTFYRDVTMKWEPTTGNFGSGIGGIHSHGGSTSELFQSVFTPVFAKDATKRLTLVVRCSWARYP